MKYFNYFKTSLTTHSSVEPPRRPHIHISAQRQKGQWLFTVQDNGQGIESQYHDQVFGILKRLHGREYSGNGVGLAICKKIVERRHGRIWVESQPGQGLNFLFTLPAAD